MSTGSFKQLVLNKYHLYNGLFMSLPYEKIENIGMLIPILEDLSRKGYLSGKTPDQIINSFFEKYTNMEDERDQINFLFRIVQYVERQVVLFDSVEDAAFRHLNDLENEGLHDTFRIAKAQDSLNEFRNLLNNFSVRIVFTAHPTQFYPPTVQHIIHDMKSAIENDDLGQIDMLLQQLGQTSFIKKEKPDPTDEARSIIYYLRNVYYRAMGNMVSQIQNKYFDQPEDFTNHNILRLGFWPGGDRDGNPFVTFDTTKEVATMLRTTLMKCYYHELKALRRRLTFNKIEPILKDLSDLIYSTMFTGKKHILYSDIISPLETARRYLISDYHGLFIEELDALITRVKIFKTHFATIDVRQDGPKHAAILQDILSHLGIYNSYTNSTFEEKVNFLVNPGTTVDPKDFDGLTKETLLNIGQIKDIQDANGQAGLNRYIISNSEDAIDVITVYGLFRLCGYQHDQINVDIIPLFETIKGFDGAEKTMKFLYAHPQYSKHIKRRGMRQTIMLGFSDGTKDGGYLKANWEIYRTKETLSKVSSEHNVKVVFFDGRGGPPARGGGKSHRFYASQGQTIANHEIQLTIQGQTITSMYGNVEQFTYNCEQLIKAGAITHLFDNPTSKINTADRLLLDELGGLSYDKYTSLKEHPQFIPYLEKISTLKYYGKANIGSRPGKRGSKATLEFSDLRAISFVGSWSQLKQNVPGYYGIGTAINTLKEQGRMDEVKHLYQNSMFFKTLMLNSMMSLEKTFFPLTRYIKDAPQFEAFWSILFTEYQLSKQMLLEISGYEHLMQEEVHSKASIAIREKIVLPLLTVQQYALQQVAKGSQQQEVYEMMVTRSLFGNINASRNSA